MELDGVHVLVTGASRGIGADLARRFAGPGSHGVARGPQSTDTPVADIHATVRVNLAATIVLTRQVLPGMLERGRGHLVVLSSLAGTAGFPGGHRDVGPGRGVAVHGPRLAPAPPVHLHGAPARMTELLLKGTSGPTVSG